MGPEEFTWFWHHPLDLAMLVHRHSRVLHHPASPGCNHGRPGMAIVLASGPCPWHAGLDESTNSYHSMKKQLVRISILQSSKIITALYVLMGLIYTLIGVPMAIFGSGQLRIMGFVYIAMPLILGVVGFVFFVIFAALYNWLAKILGGVEIEVSDT
jgi:hypothetical protein